jgi:hypothetical protein
MSAPGENQQSRSSDLDEEAAGIVRELADDGGAHVVSVLKAHKSMVFLVGRTEGRPSVVAKRAEQRTIEIEYRILDFLRSAPVRALRCYGTAPSSQPGQAWLVSEYAVGGPFSRFSEEHRKIAARWMAGIHQWSEAEGFSQLPDRGISYLHQVLAASITTLEDAEGALQRRDSMELGPLSDLLRVARRLEARWAAVEKILAAMPSVLVHSGFAGKNIVVQTAEQAPPALLAFDWEQGGWGCAAPDLSMVDLDTYRAASPEAPDRELLEQVALIGRLMWCFAALPGERVNLLGPWPDRALRKIPFYLEQCGSAFSELESRRPRPWT